MLNLLLIIILLNLAKKHLQNYLKAGSLRRLKTLTEWLNLKKGFKLFQSLIVL